MRSQDRPREPAACADLIVRAQNFETLRIGKKDTSALPRNGLPSQKVTGFPGFGLRASGLRAATRGPRGVHQAELRGPAGGELRQRVRPGQRASLRRDLAGEELPPEGGAWGRAKRDATRAWQGILREVRFLLGVMGMICKTFGTSPVQFFLLQVYVAPSLNNAILHPVPTRRATRDSRSFTFDQLMGCIRSGA